jgi:hypothetical protein
MSEFPRLDTTLDWLKHYLVPSNETEKSYRLVRAGRTWESVAGFCQHGTVFAIYKDDTSYCVHAGDDWPESDEPLLGYFDRNLSWDDLLSAIAQKYDDLRSSRRS